MSDYAIEIEIYEGKGGQLKQRGDKVIYPDVVKEGICAWMYRGDGESSFQQGQRFSLPEDNERICPWLLDSLSGIVDALSAGETLGWQYKDTPYEKVFNENGVTTEFIRCVDPTESGIVVKVIRTKL
ncbi:MAG: hypothetical protein ISR58_09355 [Anaerolineales bacterium]|nr:hypothetical protein [Chloroflexota bacterium]MBL6981382.1 hypothetical protein [Anaerolineales bacterium]